MEKMKNKNGAAHGLAYLNRRQTPRRHGPSSNLPVRLGPIVNRKSETWDMELETWNWRWEMGDWRLEIGIQWNASQIRNPLDKTL
jgi:hypothetical protein